MTKGKSKQHRFWKPELALWLVLVPLDIAAQLRPFTLIHMSLMTVRYGYLAPKSLAQELYKYPAVTIHPDGACRLAIYPQIAF